MVTMMLMLRLIDDDDNVDVNVDWWWDIIVLMDIISVAYCCLLTSGNYSNHRNNEQPVALDFDSYKLLNADFVMIDNQDKFDNHTDYKAFATRGDPWENNLFSLRNSIRALYSLYRLSCSITNSDKEYSHIVFLRPDVIYLNKLPFGLLHTNPNTLLVPDFHRSCQGGEYNDRMAMGNKHSALAYGMRFKVSKHGEGAGTGAAMIDSDGWRNIYVSFFTHTHTHSLSLSLSLCLLKDALAFSRIHTLHSERFLYQTLRNQNVRVLEFPFRFRRVRSNGEVHSRDKGIMTVQQQANKKRKIDPFYIKMFYKHDQNDKENIYCSPNERLKVSINTTKRDKK